MKLPPRFLAVVALFGALMNAPAMAGDCGFTTVSGGTASSSYDPFNQGGATITISGVQLKRKNIQGGEKTNTINFYVRGTSPNQNGTILQITGPSGSNSGSGSGFNQNIFHNSSGPFPAHSNQEPPLPGTARWEFSGNNDASDLFTVNMSVQLPANLNLQASSTLVFDIHYSCTGNGQYTETGSVPGAISVAVTVQSALRASFAGDLVGATPALAFGEIGNEVAGGKKTSNGSYIRVQATAPYKVGLSSERDFNMTVGGTATANANQKVGYNLKFLGITKTAGTTGLNAISNKQCNRPGVGDNLEDKLYIQAQLAEGGAGKAPSGNYFDTLTVTIEPLAIPASDPGFVCGGTGNGLF